MALRAVRERQRQQRQRQQPQPQPQLTRPQLQLQLRLRLRRRSRLQQRLRLQRRSRLHRRQRLRSRRDEPRHQGQVRRCRLARRSQRYIGTLKAGTRETSSRVPPIAILPHEFAACASLGSFRTRVLWECDASPHRFFRSWRYPSPLRNRQAL